MFQKRLKQSFAVVNFFYELNFSKCSNVFFVRKQKVKHIRIEGRARDIAKYI